MPTDSPQDAFNRLHSIIQTLRSDRGCPWDRQQSPASIKKYLMEETEELAEAIDRQDHNHIREEIGDLFYILILLIIMHEEEGKFTCNEVLQAISAKMIRRHPHVFAGQKTGSDSELRQQWETIKNREKNTKPCS